MTAMVDGRGDDGDDLASHGPAVLLLESWLRKDQGVLCGVDNTTEAIDATQAGEVKLTFASLDHWARGARGACRVRLSHAARL